MKNVMENDKNRDAKDHAPDSADDDLTELSASRKLLVLVEASTLRVLLNLLCHAQTWISRLNSKEAPYFTRGRGYRLESRDIMLVGLWVFVIISLVGGIYGRLDGLVVVMLFIIAVVVSYGVIAMPKARAQP